MFMESLDPRRLMAARTGQDLAYGDGGSPAFAQGFDSTGILADGAKGATFLAGFIGDRPYVTKLDDAGRVDPRYGDKGYAALPLTGKELYDARTETDTVRSLNVLSLAYDATSGAVYVGTGERTTALGGYTAGVTRLLSSGKGRHGLRRERHVPVRPCPARPRFGVVVVVGFVRRRAVRHRRREGD